MTKQERESVNKIWGLSKIELKHLLVYLLVKTHDTNNLTKEEQFELDIIGTLIDNELSHDNLIYNKFIFVSSDYESIRNKYTPEANPYLTEELHYLRLQLLKSIH